MCAPEGAQFQYCGLPSAEALGYHVAVPQRGTRSPALHPYPPTLRLLVAARKSKERDSLQRFEIHLKVDVILSATESAKDLFFPGPSAAGKLSLKTLNSPKSGNRH